MPEFLRRNWLPLAVLSLALALRLWILDVRPPHFDEGVNGGFADLIQRNGAYRYDPTRFHGPLHFYVLFLSKCLFGRNLWALRGPTVLVGVITVALLLFPLRRFFSATTCLIAGLAMAVSPAFVYYQRDAIHESWLVLFMVMAFLGWLGLWQRRARADLWMLTAGVTGMVLTKETYAIHLGCALLVWPCARLWSEVFPSFDPPVDKRQSLDWRDVVFAIGCGVAVIVFFYSATLFHPEDLRGLFETFAAWWRTGVADKGHIKPWYYWLKVLVRYEWFMVFGVVAAFRFVLADADSRLRGLAIYALGVLTAYTIISYKTPWCIIAIGWPFLVLGAAWMTEWLEAASFSAARDRILQLAVGLLVVALCTADGWRAWRLNFVDYTNEREMYAYVQTYESLSNFTDPLLELARADPRNYHLRGFIVCDKSYPVPWLLGDFSRVGYYGRKKRKPDPVPAGTPDFMLVTEDRVAEMESRLDEPFFKEMVQIFPGSPDAYAYFRASVFSKLMHGRTPEFVPGMESAPASADAMDEDTDSDDDNDR